MSVINLVNLILRNCNQHMVWSVLEHYGLIVVNGVEYEIMYDKDQRICKMHNITKGTIAITLTIGNIPSISSKDPPIIYDNSIFDPGYAAMSLMMSPRSENPHVLCIHWVPRSIKFDVCPSHTMTIYGCMNHVIRTDQSHFIVRPSDNLCKITITKQNYHDYSILNPGEYYHDKDNDVVLTSNKKFVAVLLITGAAAIPRILNNNQKFKKKIFDPEIILSTYDSKPKLRVEFAPVNTKFVVYFANGRGEYIQTKYEHVHRA